MTYEDIIEGSKLIAEFKEWKIENNMVKVPNLYPFHEMDDSENTGWSEMHASDLCFHTSFDWMKSVVMSCYNIVDDCISDLGGYNDEIEDAWGSLNIETVFETVVEFIKQYKKEQ